jgi:hypothetical protein
VPPVQGPADETAVTPVLREPVVMAVCGDQCGATYPLEAFKQVTGS